MAVAAVAAAPAALAQTKAPADKATRSMLAGMINGCLRFGEVDWAATQPVATTITEREALQRWQSG